MTKNSKHSRKDLKILYNTMPKLNKKKCTGMSYIRGVPTCKSKSKFRTVFCEICNRGVSQASMCDEKWNHCTKTWTNQYTSEMWTISVQNVAFISKLKWRFLFSPNNGTLIFIIPMKIEQWKTNCDIFFRFLNWLINKAFVLLQWGKNACYSARISWRDFFG